MACRMSVKQNLCVNFNYKKMNCNLCQRNCLMQSINQQMQINENACNNCGICQAVCPAEAIFSECYTQQSLNKRIEETGSIMLLTCHKQEEASDWPCLGFFDGTLLLALANGDWQVIIDDRSCQECKPGVYEHLKTIIAVTNPILVAGGKTKIAGGNEISGKKVTKPISRRDFFSTMFGATMEAAREVMLPIATGGEQLARRQWFHRHIDHSYLPQGQVKQGLFHSLAIAASECIACGLCAKICPRHAISIQEREAMLYISHDPLACTGCQVCVAHCHQKALTLTVAEYFNKHEVAVVQLPICDVCGDLYQPVGGQTTCFECLLKNKRQILS